ncbi:hypothetical protein NVP1031O_075 [Vibrio phage 1.031.O._10N.261.46.F8]|nr:hypothetical protein NVP1031O_075 [Vibrio phage 1.031.O._10N.261.46.F8]
MTLDLSKLNKLATDFTATRSRVTKDPKNHPVFPALPAIVDLRKKGASYQEIQKMLLDCGLETSTTTICKYLKIRLVQEWIIDNCDSWMNINGMRDNNYEMEKPTYADVLLPRNTRSKNDVPTDTDEKKRTTLPREILGTLPGLLSWNEFFSLIREKSDGATLSDVRDALLEMSLITATNGTSIYLKRPTNYFPGSSIASPIDFKTVKVDPSLVDKVVKRL